MIMSEEGFKIPEVVADRFDLVGSSYEEDTETLFVTSTVGLPVPKTFGPDAAKILQKVADADDDKVFTKKEVKEIGLAIAMAALRHQGFLGMLSP